MTCSSCKLAKYCSKFHQIHDWRLGHRKVCANSSLSPPSLTYNPSSGVVLPEWEVVTEPEGRGKGEERSEEERMREYEDYLKESGGGMADLSVSALKEMIGPGGRDKKKDKVFLAFMKRIAPERQQVIRYHRSGQPLFVSGDRIPKNSDIPKCSCGADRNFELQVMPQLLHYLQLDSAPTGPSIDWGTLIVYTCSSAHCQLGHGYHPEFLWKQDM